VGCTCGRAGRDGKFASELLLVDRHQAATAAGNAAENAKRAMLGAVDQFYDAPARLVATGLLDAHPRTLAATSASAGPGAAPSRDADDRGGAGRLLVPFGRSGGKLAVGVAAGDVREDRRGQSAAVVEPLASALDLALVGELAQHALEFGPVGVLGAEG